ncbi:GIY-YIG nuclease family protein [Nonlabens antarcticus]|uniref:GIY-YIG nuclease family protein n=1 Tax=Nonlabens antarcticus TaxID=392714 RepID=UPI001891F28B|nr:GIY-YIG nuclease family protein [Nonlabens antarcticus]
MKTILYVLYFSEPGWIKIGITKNLKKRISTLASEIGYKVNHTVSVVITNHSDSNIRLLERNFLEITRGFALNWKSGVKFSGMNEFRSGESLPILQKWLEEQQNYNLQIKFFKGIDICGRYYKGTIPKCYFPVDKSVSGVSPLLMNDINAFCKKTKIDYVDFLNIALYKYAAEKGIDRKDSSEIKNYDNYFKT